MMAQHLARAADTLPDYLFHVVLREDSAQTVCGKSSALENAVNVRKVQTQSFYPRKLITR